MCRALRQFASTMSSVWFSSTVLVESTLSQALRSFGSRHREAGVFTRQISPQLKHRQARATRGNLSYQRRKETDHADVFTGLGIDAADRVWCCGRDKAHAVNEMTGQDVHRRKAQRSARGVANQPTGSNLQRVSAREFSCCPAVGECSQAAVEQYVAQTQRAVFQLQRAKLSVFAAVPWHGRQVKGLYSGDGGIPQAARQVREHCFGDHSHGCIMPRRMACR